MPRPWRLTTRGTQLLALVIVIAGFSPVLYMLRSEEVADARLQQELVAHEQGGIVYVSSDRTPLLGPSDDLQSPLDEHLSCDGCANGDTPANKELATDESTTAPADLQSEVPAVGSPDQDTLFKPTAESAMQDDELIPKLPVRDVYASENADSDSADETLDGKTISNSPEALDGDSPVANSPMSIDDLSGTHFVGPHLSATCTCFVVVACTQQALRIDW